MTTSHIHTGANGGIGFAMSTLLASSPAYHIIMTARDPSKGTAAAGELRASADTKATISTLVLDPGSEESVFVAALNVKKDFGRLDGLVNDLWVVLLSLLQLHIALLRV